MHFFSLSFMSHVIVQCYCVVISLLHFGYISTGEFLFEPLVLDINASVKLTFNAFRFHNYATKTRLSLIRLIILPIHYSDKFILPVRIFFSSSSSSSVSQRWCDYSACCRTYSLLFHRHECKYR
jgi:hypothetical protein